MAFAMGQILLYSHTMNTQRHHKESAEVSKPMGVRSGTTMKNFEGKQ